VRLVFYMVGDGDSIKALLPCFLDPDRWPDQPIGENRMHVQVARKGLVSRYVWKFNDPMWRMHMLGE